MVPLDMASIVAEAQQRLAYMVEERQAEITLPDTWPVALGYGPWVEEVWVNYLSNALKYGGQPPRVELGASSPLVPPIGGGAPPSIPSIGGEVSGGMVRFWVRDNGPGFAPEEQAQLFTLFTRLDRIRAKGHGLGLSIVRRIVEKMGGQVGVESEVGRGSVFTFTLPGDPAPGVKVVKSRCDIFLGGEVSKMQYRKFGKLDWKVSALGFGCMRLPTKGDNENIAEPEATRMLRYALDHGVNYVDTAYPYHGGNSERFVGQLLKDGYRDKVRLATKLPCWKVEVSEDFDKYLNEQLEKLQTGHIDFYLLHALNEKSWHKVRDLGVLKWAEGAIADGRIGHLGFSFHDEYAVFQEIVDAYDGWTLCQIQYNYMDVENQAGARGLRYAASKGLAVVIMEPLLGGKLAGVPEPIQSLWDAAAKERTPVDWALQWLWNQPEVSVVLSGMSTLEQVEQNVASAGASAINALMPGELALVERVREKYRELCPIPCTKCGYCMPCLNGVDIPRNFETYNQGVMYEKPDHAREGYKWIPEDERASVCIQCRECEEKCPQSIPIAEWMVRVHEVLGEGQPYMCS
jgi:predicted aldo/keto reductase-like oxidoreductase